MICETAPLSTKTMKLVDAVASPSTNEAQTDEASRLDQFIDSVTPEESRQPLGTEDISKTANDLNQDPVKMYEFVRNTMNFEPYYGSRKGAAETLLEKGGNDFDQASLLIALFRYSGIPARYVQGVVDVPIAKAMNWVGVEKPEVAAKMFSAGGIPSQAVISGGRITALQIEHVWTEVYVNYENYRGKDAGPGKKQWTPLDPSFKQYEPDTRAELAAELLTFDMDAYLRQPPSPNPAEQFISRVATYLAEHFQDTTITELTADRKIAARTTGLLPPTLIVKALSISSEYDTLPENLRERLTLEVDGAPDGISLSKAVSIPEIAGKSITLSFELATQADDELAMSYLSPYLTPAYLLGVKPVIKVDGEVLAQGQPVAYGQTYRFKRTYRTPQGTTSLASIVIAGSDYAIALDLGHIPKSLVDKKAKELEMPTELEDVRQVLQTKDPAPEIVHLPVLAYYSALDELNWQCRRLMDVADTRMTSEGLACLDTSVTSTFGVPLAVTPSSFYLDIKRDDSVPAAANGDAAKTRDYVILSGLTGSHLEHASIEAIFGSESVSAVKLIQIATEQAVPIKTLTVATEAEVDLLATSAEVKSDIRSALSQGNQVIVPARDINYKDWKGIAYIVRDPDTGAAGYMISSTLAGGKVVEIIFGGGVGGHLALTFLGAWFVWYPGETGASAYLYFWFFWCALQHKPMLATTEFLPRWFDALSGYIGPWLPAPSPEEEVVDCTDLLLETFMNAFVEQGWDPASRALPLFMPDTTADGLAKNQLQSSRKTLLLMAGLFPGSMRGYFPYTQGAPGGWQKGDIMSVDSTTVPRAEVYHTVVYWGADPSRIPAIEDSPTVETEWELALCPLFLQSSFGARGVFVFPDSSVPNNAVLCWKLLHMFYTAEHRAWSYPHGR